MRSNLLLTCLRFQSKWESNENKLVKKSFIYFFGGELMQTRTSSRIIFLVLSAWIARTAVFALSFSSSKLQNWFCKGFNSREGLFRVSFPKWNTDHQTNNRWRSTSILIFVILVSLVGVLKIEDKKLPLKLFFINANFDWVSCPHQYIGWLFSNQNTIDQVDWVIWK